MAKKSFDEECFEFLNGELIFNVCSILNFFFIDFLSIAHFFLLQLL